MFRLYWGRPLSEVRDVSGPSEPVFDQVPALNTPELDELSIISIDIDTKQGSLSAVNANSDSHFSISSSHFRGGMRRSLFVNFHISFMKKTAPSKQPSESTRRSSRACRTSERWTFTHTSERLFALGSTDGIRRFAYRTMMGELRFLSL